MFLGPNCRNQVQWPLVTAVVGKTCPWLQPRDIALALGIGVFPQGKHRQCLGIEADRNAQAAGLVMQHGQRIALGIGIRHHVVHRFVVVLGRCAVGLPVGQIALGLVVERRHLFHRRGETSALLQERGAEVAVIQRLVFLRIVAIVGKGVIEGEHDAAGFGDQFGRDREVDLLERLLFQFTAQGDGVRWFFIDMQGDFVRRNVGGPTVQGQQFAVVDAGVADPFVSAAGDQFIETFQPTQTTTAIEFDE
ncbi:hypothetical protein [Pseudomonas sp. 58 R 3]|nr:hypothetical protein [Pseudomonas sp. 58 R 3]CRM75779.1 hypothetical protein [Pseudomonas sp. 58 R 3]